MGDQRHHLDRLIASLDVLDASDSFVHPHRGLIAVVTRKRAARRAIARLDATFGEIITAHRKSHAKPSSEDGDLFDRICDAWSDSESPAREIGIANEVVGKGRALARATELAEKLARTHRQAIVDTKRAVNMHLQRGIEGVLEFALEAEGVSSGSAEHAEILKRMRERSR